jgi:tRNA modification GTPase
VTETIHACATAAGRAGVAVIRVSGPAAKAVLEALSGPVPPPRRAVLRRLHAADATPIDDALVLWMPHPASFTGEDVAEFHVHGGPAVIAAALTAIAATGKSRMALAGEFTRRALENGRLDLAQAEGLGALIDSETEAQRRQALRQLDGALGAAITAWRDRLTEALAMVEADVDFPDEDLPGALSARIAPDVAALEAAIRARIGEAAQAGRVRDGVRIVVIGAPNAGKSSLLNALARREAAIVSDIPGTTRDVVEVRMVIGGVVAWVADTAGLRYTADRIESEGVRRALARAAGADLRIILIAPDAPIAGLEQARSGDIIVQAKADLGSAAAPFTDIDGTICVAASVTSAGGIDALESALAARLAALGALDESAVVTEARHAEALKEAANALERSGPMLTHAPELAAEDLRLALRALGRVVGTVGVEDILDVIFSRFCIGK